MRVFSVVFSCLLLTASLVHAGPPNPTASDAGGNTAGGTGALINNDEGQSNTAFGDHALHSNASVESAFGEANSAFGSGTLRSNVIGPYNTASGVEALSSNTSGAFNTASGVLALRANTTGHYNTAAGVWALSAHTAGSYNTAIGYKTLTALISGHRNTAIGSGAGALLKSGNNNIYLGSPGIAVESHTLRLGDGQTRAFIKGVAGMPISGNTVVINRAGQLGVMLSSARYKQDIQPLAARESEKVSQLRPVTFHYKTEANGALQYGLIAEEVAQVYPELITRDEAGEISGVRYEALIPLLLKELQEQRQQIEVLAQQIQRQAQPSRGGKVIFTSGRGGSLNSVRGNKE